MKNEEERGERGVQERGREISLSLHACVCCSTCLFDMSTRSMWLFVFSAMRASKLLSCCDTIKKYILVCTCWEGELVCPCIFSCFGTRAVYSVSCPE